MAETWTKGPWRQGKNYPSRVIAGDGEEARIICGTCLPADEDSPNETELANAKLIASAPELAEALRENMKHMIELQAGIHRDGASLTFREDAVRYLGYWIEEARAALAKLG